MLARYVLEFGSGRVIDRLSAIERPAYSLLQVKHKFENCNLNESLGFGKDLSSFKLDKESSVMLQFISKWSKNVDI